MNIIEMIHDFFCSSNNFQTLFSVMEISPEPFTTEQLLDLQKFEGFTKQDINVLQNKMPQISQKLNQLFSEAEMNSGTTHKIRVELIKVLREFNLSGRCVKFYTDNLMIQGAKYVRHKESFLNV